MVPALAILVLICSLGDLAGIVNLGPLVTAETSVTLPYRITLLFYLSHLFNLCLRFLYRVYRFKAKILYSLAIVL